MNNRVENILKDIINENKGNEEILKKMREKFPGITINMHTIEFGMDEGHDEATKETKETKEKKDDEKKFCDEPNCPVCAIKKILADEKYWKSDEFKATEMYKSGEEILTNKFKNDLDEWVSFLACHLPAVLENTKEFNEKLKDVVYGKMSLQIIQKNIDRLLSSKQAQK